MGVTAPAPLFVQALPSQATIVSPAALLRHVSSTRAVREEGEGGEEEPWNQDLLQALLAAIYKVSTAHHVTAQHIASHRNALHHSTSQRSAAQI